MSEEEEVEKETVMTVKFGRVLTDEEKEGMELEVKNAIWSELGHNVWSTTDVEFKDEEC